MFLVSSHVSECIVRLGSGSSSFPAPSTIFFFCMILPEHGENTSTRVVGDRCSSVGDKSNIVEEREAQKMGCYYSSCSWPPGMVRLTSRTSREHGTHSESLSKQPVESSTTTGPQKVFHAGPCKPAMWSCRYIWGRMLKTKHKLTGPSIVS